MSVRSHDDDGVVLVEVLVAFVILIGVILAGVQVFGDGMSRSRQAADRSLRVTEAASVFAALPDGIRPGTTIIPSSIPGRNFTMRVISIRSSAPEASSLRPMVLRIFEEGAESGPPLFSTIVLGARKP